MLVFRLNAFYLNLNIEIYLRRIFFHPTLGRRNAAFFKQKPTERKLTSQHPYAERFIGKPHVYTVNVQDLKAVEKALEEIDDKVVRLSVCLSVYIQRLFELQQIS